jgi:DNA-binding IclR family transcriptional regulator
VFRAATILEWIASCGGHPQSLAEIARGTDISKATCHAFVLALTSVGMLIRDEDSQRYRLGPMLFMLGKAVADDYQFAEQAQPVCRELAEGIGQPVLTAVATGSRMVVVSTTAPLRSIGIPLMAGQSVPLVPPMGAVFVAWQPESVIAAWLDRVPDLAPGIQIDLRTSLALVRKLGYGVTFAGQGDRDPRSWLNMLEADNAGQHAQLYQLARDLARTGHLPTTIEGDDAHRLLQISAPVFDRDGAVDLALVVPFAAPRMSGREIFRIAERVRAAADEVTFDRGGALPVDSDGGHAAVH